MFFLPVTFAQVSAVLIMSGDGKKEACDKLDAIELELGSTGLTHPCGGDYPAAHKHAKAFCATDGADDGHMCNIAKALVRLYACVCINMACGGMGK